MPDDDERPRPLRRLSPPGTASTRSSRRSADDPSCRPAAPRGTASPSGCSSCRCWRHCSPGGRSATTDAVDDIRKLGYGVPALEEGRWWTLFTGTVLIESLAIPLPSFTAIGVVVYEHVAGHWRTLVALIGGQVLGVLLILLVALPFRDDDGVIAQELTDVHRLRDLRRRLRLPGRVDGLPAGAAAAGPPRRWQLLPARAAAVLRAHLRLHPPRRLGPRPAGRPGPDAPPHEDRRRSATVRRRVALAVVVGGTIGILAGWNDGGIGGIFGWGPE